MIRHVVMFKFSDGDGVSAREIALKAKNMLDGLPAKISWIVNSTVGINSADAAADNYDLALTVDFTSLDDLRRYAVHPDHVAVGEFMKPYKIARTCVDFEI